MRIKINSGKTLVGDVVEDLGTKLYFKLAEPSGSFDAGRTIAIHTTLIESMNRRVGAGTRDGVTGASHGR